MKKFFLLLLATIASNSFIFANKTEEYHQFFWCSYCQDKGDMATAQKYYSKLFNAGCSLYAYKGYIPLLEQANQYAIIVKLIPKLKGLFEDDAEIQLIFAQALENTGNEVAANKFFIELSKKFKNNSKIIFYAANSYFRQRDYQKSLELIDNYLNSFVSKSDNYIFYYLKAKIYMALNQKEIAKKSIENCIKLKPSFEEAWLIWATMQEQENNAPKAIKGYQNYLKLVKKDKAIEKQIAKLKNSLKKKTL